jgi:signal transduction histidine kinase
MADSMHRILRVGAAMGAAGAAAVTRRVSAGLARYDELDKQRELQLEQARESVAIRDEALSAIAVQLSAIVRGEQPPPWPATLTDPSVAKFKDLVEALRDREAGIRGAIVQLAMDWQNAAHKMQERSNEALGQHADNPDTLQLCNSIDHAAAQMARRAQSVNILADEWPGQQWSSPVMLAEVVRAASGRIEAYKRVQVAAGPELSVVPEAAEASIHVVAELLANAAYWSAHYKTISVEMTEVGGGWAIIVEDDGLGMDSTELASARARASGDRRVGLHELGKPTQTGLAVVGAYARRCGFEVSLQETANKGIRAAVVIPSHLLVKVADLAFDAVIAPPRHAARAPGPSPLGDEVVAHFSSEALPITPTDSGAFDGKLPQRHRGSSFPAPPPSAPASDLPPPDPEATGSIFRDFALHSPPMPGVAPTDSPTVGNHELDER